MDFFFFFLGRGHTPPSHYVAPPLSLRYPNLFVAGFGGAIPHQLGNLSNLYYLNPRDDEYSSILYVMNLQ